MEDHSRHMEHVHQNHDEMMATTAAPMMDHGLMDHAAMGHGTMDHDTMDHDTMDHSGHGAPVVPSQDHSAHESGGVGHEMSMYFHGGYTETILFSCWKIHSLTGLLGSCLILFCVGVLYEGLKVFREVMQRRETCPCGQRRRCGGCCGGGSSASEGEDRALENGDIRVVTAPTFCAGMWSLSHSLQTLLHVVQLIASYLLMLVFMTYNVWLCAAVAAGAGVGYFAFAHMRPSRSAETASLAAYGDHCN